VLVATSFFENVSRHAFDKRALELGEKPQHRLAFQPENGSGHVAGLIVGLLVGTGRANIGFVYCNH